MEEQVNLAELPAALDSTLMVPRSGLQHAAVTSYGHKLRCLWIQVRKIARERDKARLDLEKAERRCLHLGRELDDQYVALKHTQSKLKDFQAEIEAKELLLQQAVSHQAKLEADTQFLQGKEASLRGRLNHVMKNTELQNKVREMTEKLSASEELVLELQKELNHIAKEKVLYDQNRVLRRELQRLRLQLQESRAETGLPAREMSLPVEQIQEQLQDLKMQLETKINYYKEQLELMQKNFERERKDSEEGFKAEMHKMEDQKRDLEETVAKYWAVINSLKEQKCMWSLELEERFEVEQARVGQHHTEDIGHPRQQLDEEGEELGTQQHQDRLSLRKPMNKLGREKVEELAEMTELTALSEKSKEISHPNVKVHQLVCEITGHKAGHSAGPGSAQLQSQRLAEAEWPRGAEEAARLEHHQKHAACWMEMELLQQQLKASQEKLLEAKASLSLAQTQHALQMKQAKAQINNMVSKQQFEQLQTTLREEQCKTQQLQESLHQQAEQTRRQLVRTQVEHEHLLQAAVEQAEGLEHSLRSAEAVLAERAAQLRDAQAQLSRNKLLIKDLRGENRGFAVALQAAELQQKSMKEKNQLLEEQASALKQLIGKITPASLSG